MNVSTIGSQPTPIQPSAETKRAALQAMLLKKAFEQQQPQPQADAVNVAAGGKGGLLDIRV